MVYELNPDVLEPALALGPGINVLGGLIGGGVALVIGILYAFQVSNIELDKTKVETIALADKIHAGAVAFLTSEYKVLSIFVFVLGFILLGIVNWQTMVCFWVGAILSGLSGWIGMQIATKANVRTTLACQGDDGLNNGLIVAFKSGSVMALMTVGTGLLGLSILYLIFEEEDEQDVWKNLSGFAFGGSSIALFARVGGGIYTKAADVGADLVGKVEEALEEDSPDNPATIADNVGDNVGDVAGMGADLFESYVGSLIAAATIGRDELGHSGVAFPFFIAGFGALCSIAGTFMVRAHPQQGADSQAVLEVLLHTIRKAIFASSVAVALCGLIAVEFCFGFDDPQGVYIWLCVVIGLVAGNCIGYFTEVATSYTYKPTQSIAEKSDTGPATVMIQGLGVGMLSTVPPVAFVVITMLACYELAEFYGIAIAAVGMLSTLGVTLATDAFGPVADNAGGIAEMSANEISDQVRETTDALDALGNTTAATGKGFAIGSAVLTALALMNAFAEEAGLINPVTDTNDIRTSLLEPVVLPGILLGALLPFVFAALTMLSVGSAAESIMWECRDQMNKVFFKEIPELQPEKCIAISTVSSLKEMVAPGALAIFMPVIVGTLLGTPGLMGLLAGAISAGFLLAVMMSNAGGAWDNAKKYVEKDNLGEGKGKHTENHMAVVVGDTVGDPFKDTSGPALNILIKLMSIISLVLARELSNDPWDQWPWAVGLSIFLLVGGYFFFKYVGSVSLHDIDAIIAQSKKRKAEQGSGDQVEMEEKEEKSGMLDVNLDDARSAVVVEPEPEDTNDD